MKKILYILALFFSTATYAYDYDIAVKNDDGVTIYYNYTADSKELVVVRSDYTGNVVIPEEGRSLVI